MNDPHVEALLYRIKHPENVDYEKAAPLEHQEPAFRLKIELGKARIEMINHHASVDSARATVDPFLRAWEMSVALERGPGEMVFVYDRAEVIDLNPTPGVVEIAGARGGSVSGATASIHVEHGKYPEPPVGIVRDDAVDLMFQRYCWYRERRTTLSDAAYYCLTVLENTPPSRIVEKTAGTRRKRQNAAEYFSINLQVLDRLGGLSSEKGGTEARKFLGSQEEFTPAERRWLDKVLPILIWRAAEKAFNATANLSEISMHDLPSLYDE